MLDKSKIYAFNHLIPTQLQAELALIIEIPGWEYGHLGGSGPGEYIPIDEYGKEYPKKVLDTRVYGIGKQDQHWKYMITPNPFNIPKTDLGVEKLWHLIKDKIEDEYSIKIMLLRAYANGSTSDRYSFIHVDSTNEAEWTILYYANLVWKPEWAGETVFYRDDHKEITNVIYPTPGKVIMFNGTIPHTGRPPSHFYRGLRVTYAFKIRIIHEEEIQKEIEEGVTVDIDIAEKQLKGW